MLRSRAGMVVAAVALAVPKPFIWTTTAEEILDSLGRLLQRSTGAELAVMVVGAVGTVILAWTIQARSLRAHAVWSRAVGGPLLLVFLAVTATTLLIGPRIGPEKVRAD